MLLIFAGALIPRKQLVNELNLFLAKTDQASGNDRVDG
jgi:hypothetical protein